MILTLSIYPPSKNVLEVARRLMFRSAARSVNSVYLSSGTRNKKRGGVKVIVSDLEAAPQPPRSGSERGVSRRTRRLARPYKDALPWASSSRRLWGNLPRSKESYFSFSRMVLSSEQQSLLHLLVFLVSLSPTLYNAPPHPPWVWRSGVCYLFGCFISCACMELVFFFGLPLESFNRSVKKGCLLCAATNVYLSSDIYH